MEMVEGHNPGLETVAECCVSDGMESICSLSSLKAMRDDERNREEAHYSLLFLLLFSDLHLHMKLFSPFFFPAL